MRRQIECPECRGEGEVVVEEGIWYTRKDTCPSCGGLGKIDDPEDDGTETLQTCSPYLLRPLRTIEQALKDAAK